MGHLIRPKCFVLQSFLYVCYSGFEISAVAELRLTSQCTTILWSGCVRGDTSALDLSAFYVFSRLCSMWAWFPLNARN